MAFNITEQDLFISLIEIFSGGAILRQFDPKRNQSVNTPFSIALSITFLHISKLSNSTAISSPSVLISLIAGCFSFLIKTSFFFITDSVRFFCSNNFIAAIPAAQQTG